MAEAEGLHLANAESNDLTAWTAQVLEGTNTFSASASAALHGSYGYRATFDGTNNDGMAYYAFTARTELYVRGYFRLSEAFSGGTGNLYLIGMRSTTSNRLFCRATISGGNVVIDRFYHQNDAGSVAVTLASPITLPLNEAFDIEMYFKASSAAGANDGIARMWYNETLVAEATGVDSDTVTVNRSYVGNFGTIVPTSSSFIDIDDVKMDTAYIGAYADTEQAVTLSPCSVVATLAGITVDQTIDNAVTLSPMSVIVSPAAITIGQTVPALVIDHTSVAKYADIPASYKTTIKTKGLFFPGESHSRGVSAGLNILETQDASFAVTTVDSGTPEMPASDHLRMAHPAYGDLTHATGWIDSHGEEDVYTNATALARMLAFMDYTVANGFGMDYMGFGHCWDLSRGTATAGVDPVYGWHWYGSTVGGPDGDKAFGIDAADYAITGNSVSMASYIAAFRGFIAHSLSEGQNIKPFFTTGPVDGYDNEAGAQRHGKHEAIRDDVDTNGGILYDFADVLAYDDAGNQHLETWSGYAYQMIAADNLLDLDGVDRHTTTGYHFGQRGALRLAKAIWVMIALDLGWDGEPETNAVTLSPCSVIATPAALAVEQQVVSLSPCSVVATPAALSVDQVPPQAVTLSPCSVAATLGALSVEQQIVTLSPASVIVSAAALTIDQVGPQAITLSPMSVVVTPAALVIAQGMPPGLIDITITDGPSLSLTITEGPGPHVKIIEGDITMDTASPIIMAGIEKKSTKPITVAFSYPVAGVDTAFVPKTASWSLYDINDAIVNEKEDEEITPLAASVTIVLSGLDLDAEMDNEMRKLVIKGTFDSAIGADLPFVKEIRFPIIDIAGK